MNSSFKSHKINTKDSSKEIIYNNRNMHRYTPIEKSIRIKNLSFQTDIRIKNSKTRKNTILQSKKTEIQTKILEKFRKFEIRCKKQVKSMQEAINVKKSWILLNISICICFISKKIIENRKILKSRVSKNVNWLRIVCRCILKFKLILKKIKIKRSYEVILI
jgi:hypothetical protein